MSKKANILTLDKAQDDRDIAASSVAWDEPRGSCEEFDARLRFETLIADLSSNSPPRAFAPRL